MIKSNNITYDIVSFLYHDLY